MNTKKTKDRYSEALVERCVAFADYVIKTGATVRKTAKYFGKSKSTVHKDITSRLRYIDRAKWRLVKTVLEKNRLERHIRGGEATKIKYSKMRGGAPGRE